jgi:hypothetical protein
MKPCSPTPWFLGTTIVDPGEEGWDGTIQSGPSNREIEDAEEAKGTINSFIPAPTEIGSFCYEGDAQIACALVNASDQILEALKMGYTAVVSSGGTEGIASRTIAAVIANIERLPTPGE